MVRARKEPKGNRTDLNSALKQQAPSEGREFGAVARDEAAQQAVPMGPPPRSAGLPSTPAPQPGSLGPFAGRSQYPARPVTDGVNIGPGRGSDALLASQLHQARLRAQSLKVHEWAQQTGDPLLLRLASRIPRV